jgi:hypothetical protein
MASPDGLAKVGAAPAEVQSGETDLTQEGTPQLQQLINTSTASGAERWIFHHPEDGALVPPRLHDPGEQCGRARIDVLPDTVKDAMRN